MKRKKYTLFFILIILSLFVNCNKKVSEKMQNITIHYHRYDNKYENWSLWTWLDQKTVEIENSERDDFGLIFKADLTNYPPQGNINLLPKYKNWEDKDAPEKIWARSMKNEIWLVQGNPDIFVEKPDIRPFIRKTFIDKYDRITAVLSNPVNREELADLNPRLKFHNGREMVLSSAAFIPENSDSSVFLQLKTDDPININNLPGELYINGFKSGELIQRGILDSSDYFSREPLGVFYSTDKTKFSVYAPGASEVILNLYKKPVGGKSERKKMDKCKNGVWSLIVAGDLIGKYYTYNVDGPGPGFAPEAEIIDPYARCTTSHDGRGMIVNDRTEIVDSPVFPFNDAVIYEMHVRDFTIAKNSGVIHRGKYLGFVEEGTKLAGTDISTGIDHLVELGVNTVQIMPIQDFEHEDITNGYFWGYMPVNFNAPDGWYATHPFDDSSVKEFKKLVDGLHKKGIKVIMDVVYNHTAEGNPHIRYNFNGFAPDFYYRTKLDGAYWNGSGCGNELRSENPMVRRFIIESLKYWVQEYKIDGFRFDLMGLHDMETMEQIVKTLRNIKNDIFIYGEPWTAGATPITPTEKGSQRGKGFAVFNDHFRDAIKGPWYNIDPGYIQTGKNVDAIKKGIVGSLDDFADSPLEVINYVVCHDGRTLWDRLVATTEEDSFLTDTELIAMDKLAAAILFTSQGTPFIHGGQEFLRTKFGSHNSYNQPDKINKIRWDYKQENMPVFEYYKGLIKLRKEHPLFRMDSAAQIRKNIHFFEQIGLSVPKACVAYKINRENSGDKWREVLVLINPNKYEVSIRIPEKKWVLVVDDNKAGTDIIAPISDPHIILKPISAKVLYRL